MHECDSMFLAGPGIVVAICVLIMLYAYALSNRRGLDNLMYAAILFCGAGGYVLGALAGNSPRTTLPPSHPPMEDALSSSSQSLDVPVVHESCPCVPSAVLRAVSPFSSLPILFVV